MTRIEVVDNRGNGINIDTNIAVHDPLSIITLQEEQKNTVHITFDVINELAGLKNRPDIGIDAREALRNIEAEKMKGNPSLKIISKLRWNGLQHSIKAKVDDRIIAATHQLWHENQKSKNFKKIKLVTNDTEERIIARENFNGKKDIEVEEYHKDESDVIQYTPPFELEVEQRHIEHDRIVRGIDFPDSIKENQGVILVVNEPGGKKTKRPALRKGDNLEIIPFDIKACEISPKSLNGNGTNWSQYFALQQLLDPEIDIVFLIGGAGTGKTLLTLAASVENKRQYKQILVSRPMVHLEDKDNMGFLPGDVREKMGPWLRPIYQNLDELKQHKINKEKIEKMLLERKIDIEPLDYIRGTTFSNSILFVDEAQNLTPHQIRTIITRAGEGTKIIFTGDLDQIDRRRRLTPRLTGINYAANGMLGSPYAAVTTFKDTVRSRLVHEALKRLK